MASEQFLPQRLQQKKDFSFIKCQLEVLCDIQGHVIIHFIQYIDNHTIFQKVVMHFF